MSVYIRKVSKAHCVSFTINTLDIDVTVILHAKIDATRLRMYKQRGEYSLNITEQLHRRAQHLTITIMRCFSKTIWNKTRGKNCEMIIWLPDKLI